MIDWDGLHYYKKRELRDMLWGVMSLVDDKLCDIRMGVYDEERHGDLRETLEELEGLL